MGIDLYPNGVAANDDGDADSGANDLQNYPVLTVATSDTKTTTVEGTLNSTASTTFDLDFYASPACETSGYGEGALYLGSGQATTGADGNASFSFLVSGAAPDGWAVTATATNPGGSTSEFSACVTAAEVSPPPDDGEYEWHYQYDDLSRVTYACSDGWTGSVCAGDEFHYRYDGAGNLTRFDKWNVDNSEVETVRYVINDANQIQCIDADASGDCNASETLWEYDAYGNLIDDGTITYEYNTANRLTSVTDATSTTTYVYNGDGDRISQTANGTLTTYVLDTATPLTMVLSETTGTETVRYWHGLDTLAQSDGTTTEYFAYDGLGSVRQLVDETGSVTLAQTFDPYGSGYATSGSASSSLGWTGEQTDGNGFVYLRARYYAPGMGRFTQMDPSRLENNPYLYSAGNPVMYTDPSGLAYCGADGCSAESVSSSGFNQSATVKLTISLSLPPSFLALDKCSEGLLGNLMDFYEGFAVQIMVDTLVLPVNTVIDLVASIRGIPLEIDVFLSGITTGNVNYFNTLYWTGSDAYRLGRNVGRWASMGIGAYLAVSGIVTAIGAVVFTVPTAGLAAVCEGVTAGLCTPLAAGVLVVDVAAVATGVAVATYGGLILASIAQPGNTKVGGKDPTLSYGSNTGNTSKNARILRDNMGVGQTPGQAAHHIVASTHPRAARARQILQKFGIDINQAENGVLLTQDLHNGLANNYKYIDEVNRLLGLAKNKAQALDVLEDIATRLLASTFPR